MLATMMCLCLCVRNAITHVGHVKQPQLTVKAVNQITIGLYRGLIVFVNLDILKVDRIFVLNVIIPVHPAISTQRIVYRVLPRDLKFLINALARTVIMMQESLNVWLAPINAKHVKRPTIAYLVYQLTLELWRIPFVIVFKDTMIKELLFVLNAITLASLVISVPTIACLVM